MTAVTLALHFEQQDSGETSWWAESDEEPGLYIAGRSFAEVAALAREALVEDYGPGVSIRWSPTASSETVGGPADPAASRFSDTTDTAVRISA